MSAGDPVQLVAITGGSGAGKTWLADRLQFLLGKKAGRLTQDSFYRDCSHLPPAERSQLNFDDPAALDWSQLADVLQTLRNGRACRLPAYDFHTHCRLPDGEFLRPRPLMIVDGLWLLHHPEVRRLFDLTVFLHCPEDERLRRRIARDTVERDRSAAAVLEQFQATVAPMHGQFVSPQAAHADLLLHHPCRESEILQLQERLSRLVPFGTGVRDRLMALFRSETQPLARTAGAFS
jgi:uridine kinase